MDTRGKKQTKQRSGNRNLKNKGTSGRGITSNNIADSESPSTSLPVARNKFNKSVTNTIFSNEAVTFPVQIELNNPLYTSIMKNLKTVIAQNIQIHGNNSFLSMIGDDLMSKMYSFLNRYVENLQAGVKAVLNECLRHLDDFDSRYSDLSSKIFGFLSTMLDCSLAEAIQKPLQMLFAQLTTQCQSWEEMSMPHEMIRESLSLGVDNFYETLMQSLTSCYIDSIKNNVETMYTPPKSNDFESIQIHLTNQCSETTKLSKIKDEKIVEAKQLKINRYDINLGRSDMQHSFENSYYPKPAPFNHFNDFENRSRKRIPINITQLCINNNFSTCAIQDRKNFRTVRIEFDSTQDQSLEIAKISEGRNTESETNPEIRHNHRHSLDPINKVRVSKGEENSHQNHKYKSHYRSSQYENVKKIFNAYWTKNVNSNHLLMNGSAWFWRYFRSKYRPTWPDWRRNICFQFGVHKGDSKFYHDPRFRPYGIFLRNSEYYSRTFNIGMVEDKWGSYEAFPFSLPISPMF